MYKNIPLQKPKPDCGNFIDILMGRDNSRVPPVEYIVDGFVMRPVIEEMLDRTWTEYGTDRKSQKRYLDNYIEFWYRMGYDFVRFETDLGFSPYKLETVDTAPGSSRNRIWMNEHKGKISEWKDIEKFAWPKIEEFDFFPFEYLNDNIPEGMGLISCHGGGVFEHLSWMMSIEGLSLAIYDNPDLVEAVVKKIGMLITKFYKHILDLDNLKAVFQGDDMGFKTGTLVSPQNLRKYILPWHKMFAAMSHEKGLPYFLHSCGNVERIMENLINDVGIDGKHSFENAIIPVEKFQEKYGDRIAVLGGMDLNILSAQTQEEVRKHTRYLIETCGPRGRYAIGSGNSIPSYVPVENYLTMADEALNL